PRPALFNQDDLIKLRTEKGVCSLMPGITGWAQTHGRDEIPIPLKVDMDEYYLIYQSFGLDMQILWLSLKQAFSGKNVSH
ncbi:MAG: sugar transferase, partial [Kiritimatiellales bacterium]